MNNYTIDSADRDTHIRIVTVALTISIVIAWLGMAVLN